MKGDESLVKPIKIGGSLVTMAALIFCFVQPAKADDIPIDPASETGATISKDVDTANNEHPDMSTEFFMYIPPDPNTPVGVIEIDKPGSDGKYSGGISKPFPQTGGASSGTLEPSAANTVTILLDNTNAAPKFLWKNGRLYLLQNISESPMGEPLEETKTYTDLSSKSVPQTIEVTQGGSTIVLALRDVQYEEITPEIDGKVDHGYTLSMPDAPEEKEITYTDPDTGMELTISAPLISTEQVEGYDWHPVEFPMRYYGEPGYEIFQLDDTFIPYQDEEPYWREMDALVFRHLKLSPKKWRLTGSEWLGDWQGEAITGRPVRYGVLYGEMYAAHWVSHYSTSDAVLTTYNATATYTDSKDSSTLQATYTEFISLPVLIGAAVGLLLLLIFIIVLLFLLKRKREDKNGQRNTGDQG